MRPSEGLKQLPAPVLKCLPFGDLQSYPRSLTSLGFRPERVRGIRSGPRMACVLSCPASVLTLPRRLPAAVGTRGCRGHWGLGRPGRSLCREGPAPRNKEAGAATRFLSPSSNRKWALEPVQAPLSLQQHKALLGLRSLRRVGAGTPPWCPAGTMATSPGPKPRSCCPGQARTAASWCGPASPSPGPTRSACCEYWGVGPGLYWGAGGLSCEDCWA